MSNYMGLTFEKMCRDYILYYDEKLPFPIGAVGQWWGGNPKTRRQAQIDVVVTSAEGDSAIIGSCKFRETPTGEEELRLMEEYADAMGHFANRYYYFFAKSGFSAGLESLSEKGQVRLLTLAELYEADSQEEKEKNPV